MNKFILCAMDKSKTKQELIDNASIAADIADYAFKHYQDADAASNATIAIAGNGAAFNMTHGEREHWLKEYFTVTGEKREDYEKEIAKNESSK